jgi:hypothetical protein
MVQGMRTKQKHGMQEKDRQERCGLAESLQKNFRNFKSLDVKLGEHAVVLGENKVGKTNLLFALRLILDPSLPDSSRRLRLGYGIYRRAVVSGLSGDPILYSRNGFPGAARQALTKLGVTGEPCEAERDYNDGSSMQVPLNPVVRVKGRFSRGLRDGKQELVLAR